MRPRFVSNFDRIWISSTDFLKIPQYQILGKSTWSSLADAREQKNYTRVKSNLAGYENAPKINRNIQMTNNTVYIMWYFMFIVPCIADVY